MALLLCWVQGVYKGEFTVLCMFLCHGEFNVMYVVSSHGVGFFIPLHWT